MAIYHIILSLYCHCNGNPAQHEWNCSCQIHTFGSRASLISQWCKATILRYYKCIVQLIDHINYGLPDIQSDAVSGRIMTIR